MSRPARGARTTSRRLEAQAARLIARGAADEAYATLRRAAGPAPHDPRLAQLLALALARLARTPEARRDALAILARLGREGTPDVETLGLIARIQKDVGLEATDPRERATGLARALRSYRRAWRHAPSSYWVGVNAATLAALLGQPRAARRDAARVARLVEAALPRARGPERYWALATRGEAALLAGDVAAAHAAYARAHAAAAGDHASLASTRRNLRLVLSALGQEALWPDFDRRLAPPAVAVLHPAASRRPTPDPGLGQRARAWIRATGAGIVFAPATPGPGLAFLEAALAAGGAAHVVLPYDAAALRGEHARGPHGRAWARRFDRVCARATRIHLAGGRRAAAGPVERRYLAAFLDGVGRLRARELDAPLLRVAVRADGRVGERPPPPGAARGGRIVTALFGDAEGFSRLSQAEAARFVRDGLGLVARVARPFRPRILEAETWGDGLLVLLDDVEAAGNLAVALAAEARQTSGSRLGLPQGLRLRLALHTGPVEFARDPLSGRRRAFGPHLSHAARIEPVTPPGHVYASESFAALALVQGACGFDCTPLGAVDWAKGYARLPLFRVEPSTPPA